MSSFMNLMEKVTLPKMALVRQHFEAPLLEKPETFLYRQLLSRTDLSDKIRPGMSIGITGGSRGIDHMPALIREIVTFCKERRAQPFVFPAMGSHGGATAEGQKQVLYNLGITEEYCGCPIRATMETVQIGKTPEGESVYFDRYAYEADGVIVVNRIKPHTTFRGPYESGLMKMLTIGCGKQLGAATCHEHGFRYMHRLVPECGTVALQNVNILFGVGTIENTFDQLAEIHVLSPQEIIQKEPELLKRAFKLMGKIYFQDIDLLIIDEIGKDISGGGADPNISGHYVSDYVHEGIKAQRRVVLSLSEKTHGNANGVGNFDVISRRVFEEIDLKSTYANSITCTQLHSSKIPMMMDNDKETIFLGLYACLEGDMKHPRVVRIKNTAELQEIYISEALLSEAEKHPNIEILSKPASFIFNEQNNLF